MLWVFDVNETMLDLAPLDAVFERHAGDGGLRTAWFDLMIRDALVVTASGGYQDFGRLGAGAARALVPDITADGIAELAATIRTLPAHPEVPAALAALRDRGDRAVALGNSPRATVEAQVGNSGLAPLLAGVYSAEHVGALKPAPAPYRMVLEAEGVQPGEAVLVAAHDWDIAGAQAVGMHTVYVKRSARGPLPGWPAPDAVVPDLAAAVAARMST